MADYHIPLLPGNSYHILSRAVGDEKAFREETNYQFFISRFQKHVSPVADTYCFCLLPNHFHFIVRIKDEEKIREHFNDVKKYKEYKKEIASDFIMERFGNLLNSYVKAYNKMYKRKGSLFIDYMRRVHIETEKQFCASVFYIHKNPVHHGYCEQIENWPWSSYKALISDQQTDLLRQQVLENFGSLEEFLNYHKQSPLKNR